MHKLQNNIQINYKYSFNKQKL